MPVESETPPNRQQPTTPLPLPAATAPASAAQESAPLSRRAQSVLGRVKVAFGGRDLRAEALGLASALKHANGQQAGAIVDQLLELVDTHAGSDALAAMAGVFSRLEPAKAERVIAAGHGQWARACAIAIIDPDAACRASVAGLIGRLADPEVVPLLATLLKDSDPAVADAAGKAVVTLADRLTLQPALDPPARQTVHQLIAAAVDTFDRHRQREALGALLIVCSSPASLRGMWATMRSWFTDAGHPAHLALRGMIRRADGFATRDAAWALMAIDAYRTACADRLSAETDSDGHARVLERGHLLLNPARSETLAAAHATARRGHAPGLEITPETIAELSDKAARFAPTWAALVSPNRATQQIEALLGHGSAHSRIGAVRSLGDLPPTPETAGLLADFSLDSHELTGRMALHRAMAPEWREAIGSDALRVTLGGLSRSQSIIVRESAAMYADALTPGIEAGSVVLARRMLRADRQKFTAETHARLRSPNADIRLGAIRLIQRLHIGAGFELELLAMVSQSGQVSDARDPAAIGVLRCAASAVQALAELTSPAAHHAVHKCLRHADARIRANALDALARTARRRGSIAEKSTPLASAIVEFKDDPAHRVRVGATRAELLQAELNGNGGLTRGTVSALGPMLADERPMHRISGLWLAERVVVRAAGETQVDQNAANALAGTIADLVRTDPDPDVRMRARQSAARVLAAMRGGWAERAATI